MKEEIALKHLAKYYTKEPGTINGDDILPMSRILPMMDEYAQEYSKSQSPTQSQAGRVWDEEMNRWVERPNKTIEEQVGNEQGEDNKYAELYIDYTILKGKLQAIQSSNSKLAEAMKEAMNPLSEDGLAYFILNEALSNNTNKEKA